MYVSFYRIRWVLDYVNDLCISSVMVTQREHNEVIKVSLSCGIIPAVLACDCMDVHPSL